MNTRKIITYKPLRLKNGYKATNGIKPKKRMHKLYIDRMIDEFGDGWYWFLEDELYKNIIVDGNRDFITRNDGDFSELYEDINLYADEAMSEIEDCEIEPKTAWYDNQTSALKAYFERSASVKITPYITGQFKKIMRTAKNDDEQIAALMTLFSPYTWEWCTMQGYSQGDWNDALYPIELYNKQDIKTFEAFYMGMYSEYVYTYKGETYGDYITDDEAWHNEEKIMSAACYCFGLSPDEVEIVKR